MVTGWLDWTGPDPDLDPDDCREYRERRPGSFAETGSLRSGSAVRGPAGLRSSDNRVVLNSGAHPREPSQVGTTPTTGPLRPLPLTFGVHRRIEIAVLADP